MVIWIQCRFILKHHPLEPLEFMKLTYVGCLSRHNHFRDLMIQFVDAMCSIRSYIGLKLNAIIPMSFWGTRLNELPTGTFLQFLYFSFSSIQPCGEWLYLPKVTTYLLEFSVELTKEHFFGIITYYHRWYTILLNNASWASLFSFIGNEHD